MIYAVATPLVRTLTLSALLALVACASESPAPASTPAPAVTAEPAVTQVATPPAAPQTAATPQDTPATEAAPATAPPADNSTADENRAEEQPPAVPAAPVAMPEGPEPRLGTDYFLIDPPQMMAAMPGKVEVAEVFSYTCIHCARLEAMTPAWKKTLPAEVNFVYAPMSHGAFEPIARGFYAAQAMGVLEQTHSGMFKALAEQQKLGRGRLDDIAALYAELDVDAYALKATAGSFAINTQISRSQRTLARWAIESTPSIVVAGKYRVAVTGGGHQGMLDTARWLAQRELAEQARSTP